MRRIEILSGIIEKCAEVICLDLKSFFAGKRVLITGHTGFKGSWLCQILIGFGAKVHGYSLAPNTEPNLYEILGIGGRLCGEKIADIREYKSVKKFFDEAKPEIVFHLAAQPLVRDSYDEPRYTFDTNVMGTANVLEAIRNSHCVKSAVIITTDKVYENNDDGKAFVEKDRLGAHEPYSTSKACAEFVVESYRKSFFACGKNKARVATARAGNVIGGGDWSKDRLVPDIIRAKQNGKTLKIRNPDAVRPWQHVLEPLEGYLLLAKGLYEGREELACAFNFASDEKSFISVKKIVEKSGVKFEVVCDNSKPEMQVLKLDAKRAEKMLGWKGRINIERALGMAFDWYDKYYLKKEDIAKYTDGQIGKYFAKEAK